METRVIRYQWLLVTGTYMNENIKNSSKEKPKINKNRRFIEQVICTFLYKCFLSSSLYLYIVVDYVIEYNADQTIFFNLFDWYIQESSQLCEVIENLIVESELFREC